MDLMPRKIYLDDLFDDFLTTRKEQHMKCDIYEKGGDYHIEMDIPGSQLRKNQKKMKKIKRKTIFAAKDLMVNIKEVFT